MKLFHLSDLHIGKKVNDYSMLDEQKYIFRQILEDIKREKPDAILISGDVYDKTTPPLEAVMLLDEFLNQLEIDGLSVFLISGNHDSPERLSFGAKRMEKSGLYIKSIFDGDLSPVTLTDEYGDVNFYSLPFIRISNVNHVFNTQFRDYSQAVSYVIKKANPDFSQRNVILSHQYVAGASFSESESSIGGIDSVSPEVYEGFDYTALGHVHKTQNIGSERLRYCGTPLKYSASETGQEKSYTVIELHEKTDPDKPCRMSIHTVPIIPLHEMIRVQGTFDELMRAPVNENDIVTEDLVYAELTDSDYVNNAAAHLRMIYPNLLSVSYSRNTKTSNLFSSLERTESRSRTPLEIFEEFYEKTHGGDRPDEMETEILKKAIREVWGEEAKGI